MVRWFVWLLTVAPTAAMAQQDQPTIAGAWFDGEGNEVNLPGKLVSYDQLKPGARPLSEVIALFRDACLTVAVGTEAARPAVDARADWGFRYIARDAGVPSKGLLDGWQASDVSITSQPRTWPLAECNVLTARAGREDMIAVSAALSAALGRQPDKHYRPRAADGRHLEGEAARWSVDGVSGVSRKVYASSYLDQNGAYSLHLGLTEARPK